MEERGQNGQIFAMLSNPESAAHQVFSFELPGCRIDQGRRDSEHPGNGALIAIAGDFVIAPDDCVSRILGLEAACCAHRLSPLMLDGVPHVSKRVVTLLN